MYIQEVRGRALTFIHRWYIQGEVRCTLLDFPGFSRGCGRAVDRVEGGGVQEGGGGIRSGLKRTAKSSKGVREDGCVVEGGTIMSGAREGEQDKKGVRGGDSGEGP